MNAARAGNGSLAVTITHWSSQKSPMTYYAWPLTHRFNHVITELIKQETVGLYVCLIGPVTLNMMQVHEIHNTEKQWNVKLSTVHRNSLFFYPSTIAGTSTVSGEHVTPWGNYVEGTKCTKMFFAFSSMVSRGSCTDPQPCDPSTKVIRWPIAFSAVQSVNRLFNWNWFWSKINIRIQFRNLSRTARISIGSCPRKTRRPTCNVRN